jgi:hypothetical protein
MKTAYYWRDLWKYLSVAFTAPIVVPIALKATGKYSPHLKQWAYLWDTPDQELPGDMSKVGNIYNKHGYFWAAYYWLGWRNRGYGAARKYGAQFDFPVQVHTNGVFPDDKSDSRGIGRHSITTASGTRYWEVYGVFGKSFGIRFRFGWKLQPLIRKPVADWEHDKTATGSLAFHISLRKLGA